MTRTISLFLTLLLLSALLLSGCGGREPEKSSIVPSATETPAAESVSEPSPASETAPAEEGETAEAERQLSLGQFSGSTYTATQNGVYTFTLESGSDTVTQTVTVSKLDTTAPTVSVSARAYRATPQPRV